MDSASFSIVIIKEDAKGGWTSVIWPLGGSVMGAIGRRSGDTIEVEVRKLP